MRTLILRPSNLIAVYALAFMAIVLITFYLNS